MLKNKLKTDKIRRGHKKLGLFGRRAIFLLAGFSIFSIGYLAGHGNLTVSGLSTQQLDTSNSEHLDYSSADQLYGILKKNFDGNLDKNKLMDGINTGLVEATGDPYTTYFTPKEAQEFGDQLSGSFTGIGAELGSDADNNIIIVSPLSGYPADKAGLKPRDIIAAINGQSTSGMRIDAVVKKIRGPENTKVTLTIVRGSGQPFDVVLTRAKIEVASVKWQIDEDVGYIKISQFNGDTVRLARQAADEFKAKGVKGIVLDLRGNPGGYLSGAVDVSSLWFDSGKTVVAQKHGGKVTQTEYSNGEATLKGLPTVVLIDGGSASASEITAGALHDNGAAILAGEKSFGKGSVQQVINLKDGSEIKVTIAHWYTPGGKNIDKQGIKPDTEVKPADGDSQASGKDAQKDKAYEILRSKMQGTKSP